MGEIFKFKIPEAYPEMIDSWIECELEEGRKQLGKLLGESR